jgi:putative two-component system response regulator
MMSGRPKLRSPPARFTPPEEEGNELLATATYAGFSNDTKRRTNILIVDDENSIREVLAEGLMGAGYPCSTASDADDAMRKLQSVRFNLVLSDIRMPGGTGLELLEQIKDHDPDIDVIMVSGVVDTGTAIESIRQGARDYVTKPFNLTDVLFTVDRVVEQRRLVEENRLYQQDLEHKVAERTEELSRKNKEVQSLFVELKTAFNEIQNTYEATLEALIAALDSRDSETQGHSMRVSEFTALVAGYMGISEPELTDIRRGALLHDVGKIGIPDAILRKPGPLDAEEWTVMEEHPQLGYDMLKGITFLEGAIPIVLSHQEKYDGTGYPHGLKTQGIPLGARIFSVVDTYDAITNTRPYRKGRSYEVARDEIVKFSGTQFDPRVVETFLKIPQKEFQEISDRIRQGFRGPRQL